MVLNEKNGKNDNDYSIQIILTDRRTKRPIFEWRPGRGNVALGIRKAAEVATAKLGEDLEKEGVILTEKQRDVVSTHADH